MIKQNRSSNTIIKQMHGMVELELAIEVLGDVSGHMKSSERIQGETP